MAEGALGFLEDALFALDTPGAMVRTAIGGGDPMAAVTDAKERMYGRDLLRQWGLIGPDDTWGNFTAGLAADVLLDPLNYAFMGLGSLSKARHLAKVGKANKAVETANVAAKVKYADEVAAGFMPADVAAATRAVDEAGVPVRHYRGSPQPMEPFDLQYGRGLTYADDPAVASAAPVTPVNVTELPFPPPPPPRPPGATLPAGRAATADEMLAVLDDMTDRVPHGLAFDEIAAFTQTMQKLPAAVQKDVYLKDWLARTGEPWKFKLASGKEAREAVDKALTTRLERFHRMAAVDENTLRPVVPRAASLAPEPNTLIEQGFLDVRNPLDMGLPASPGVYEQAVAKRWANPGEALEALGYDAIQDRGLTTILDPAQAYLPYVAENPALQPLQTLPRRRLPRLAAPAAYNVGVSGGRY